MTVDLPPLRVLQDLEMSALVFHRKPITREQADGKEGDENYVVYYKFVSIRREEPNGANNFR